GHGQRDGASVPAFLVVGLDHRSDLGCRRAGLPQVDDRQVAVGADRVPAAVAMVVAGGEVLQVAYGDAVVAGLGCGERGQHVVPFGVDVGIDAVGDLQGEVGQSDRAVVGAGGEPVHHLTSRQAPPVRAG